SEVGLPCFLYGPSSSLAPARSLPELRRHAFGSICPDIGPQTLHSRAGAVCVGARPILVAYNLWLESSVSLEATRAMARAVRSPEVRALGLDVGGRRQLSMNLIEPTVMGPAEVYDFVAHLAPVSGTELVGLMPAAVLATIPRQRWAQLDVAADRTIEARLEAASADR
ncbi:MAG: hypothetical protein ACRDRT_16925, partial [Pseudonocardiaceae bacterium]